MDPGGQLAAQPRRGLDKRIGRGAGCKNLPNHHAPARSTATSSDAPAFLRPFGTGSRLGGVDLIADAGRGPGHHSHVLGQLALPVATIRTAGQTGHLPVHGGCSVPNGPLRLQTADERHVQCRSTRHRAQGATADHHDVRASSDFPLHRRFTDSSSTVKVELGSASCCRTRHPSSTSWRSLSR